MKTSNPGYFTMNMDYQIKRWWDSDINLQPCWGEIDGGSHSCHVKRCDAVVTDIPAEMNTFEMTPLSEELQQNEVPQLAQYHSVAFSFLFTVVCFDTANWVATHYAWCIDTVCTIQDWTNLQRQPGYRTYKGSRATAKNSLDWLNVHPVIFGVRRLFSIWEMLS